MFTDKQMSSHPLTKNLQEMYDLELKLGELRKQISESQKLETHYVNELNIVKKEARRSSKSLFWNRKFSRLIYKLMMKL